ncbi:MAG: histidine kinase [Bacteroidetes bacterium]|nr:histidine kinase [Bacteroidota bacterium]
MKSIRILFLFAFLYSSAQVYAQDNVQEINKCKVELTAITSLEKQVQQHSRINDLYQNLLSDKYVNAKAWFAKAKQTNNKHQMAMALATMGYCENNNGTYVIATQSLNEACQLFLNENDSLHYILTLSELSISKRRSFLYNEAESISALTFEYVQRKKAEAYLPIICYNIASVYLDMELFDKALYYGQIALKSANKQRNFEYAGFAYMILGRVSEKYNNNKKAEEYFLLGEKELDKTNKCVTKGINYYYLIQLYDKTANYLKTLLYLDLIVANNIKQGHPPQQIAFFKNMMLASIYEKQGNYKEAIACAETYLAQHDSAIAAKTTHESQEYKSYPRVLIPLSKALVKSGNVKQAEEKALYSLSLSKRYGRKLEIVEITEVLASIYTLNKDYKKAYEFEKTRNLYHDSLLAEKSTREVQRLETVYKTENLKNEKNILSKENKVKELQVSQSKMLTIAAIILLIVVSISIYLYFQRKKIKNEKDRLEVEQRFLLSQLNPHFIFNSLIAIQSYILTSNQLDAGKYLAKFSKLIRNILENSREEFIALQQEINTIEYYLELQQLRFNNSFSYKLNIPSSIDTNEIEIPPMFVQPFLENSIEHGFRGEARKWQIEINVSKIDNANICIEIIDNGVGRKKSNDFSAPADTEHKSLATKIINDRIEILQNQRNSKSQIIIEDIDNGDSTGTKVKLILPYIPSRE